MLEKRSVYLLTGIKASELFYLKSFFLSHNVWFGKIDSSKQEKGLYFNYYTFVHKGNELAVLQKKELKKYLAQSKKFILIGELYVLGVKKYFITEGYANQFVSNVSVYGTIVQLTYGNLLKLLYFIQYLFVMIFLIQYANNKSVNSKV